MLKKNKVSSSLKLLNPKHLEQEVHIYGYNFSWKKHVLLILSTLLGICIIGILFRLNSLFFSLTVGISAIMLPIFILDMYKRMFEQKRFSDAVTYAEQVLYSFQKSRKVVSALKETTEIFEDGKMKHTLEDAIEHLEIGQSYSEKGVLREALELIEKPYSCVKIHMVHELLISSEEYGGDMTNSIPLILNDIELWKRRGYKLMADKKKSHTDNIISIIVATILCAVALYVIDSMGKMFPNTTGINVFKTDIIQTSSFVFILFMIYVLVKSFKNLSGNWLQSDSLHDDKYVLSSYETVMNYDDAKEKKKSLLLSLPFILGAAISIYFKQTALCILLILIAVFMLTQHNIGYKIAKKDINKELYLALPQWLIEIALLLQNNNVQVSILKSSAEAPPVLQVELTQLAKRLQEHPGELLTYTSFCNQFDVPEITSCMKMLHAISESGVGNADIQITNLIKRVYEMQNFADTIRSQSAAFRMQLIFTYPVIAATIKLLIDLTFGTIFMFQMLGGMGGVS